MGALTPRRLTRAADPTTPRLLLAAYLWHPLPWMARVAATNPRTPRWARRTTTRQHRLLDITLARTTSPHTLARYARDPDLTDTLLRRVITNPHIDAAALAVAATHPHASAGTLIDIISSAHCPPALAADIVTSLEPTNQPARLDSDVERWRVYLAATDRTDLPGTVLAWLARTCPHPRVLRNIALHPNTPRADAIALALTDGTPIPTP